MVVLIKRQGLNWRKVFNKDKLRPWQLGLLFALFLVLAGLNIERYGYNVIKYRTPIPACDSVLSVEACKAYGPWKRNSAPSTTAPAKTGTLKNITNGGSSSTPTLLFMPLMVRSVAIKWAQSSLP